MKKIFMTLTVVGTLSTAMLLTACNNAEQVKKQQEEEAAQIQSLVDQKLSGLQAEVDAECMHLIDSVAQVNFTAWQAEEAAAKKGGKKPATKPKPVAKKEEPKTGLGAGKVGTESTPAKIGEGKQGTAAENEKAKLGKGKAGTQTPPK